VRHRLNFVCIASGSFVHGRALIDRLISNSLFPLSPPVNDHLPLLLLLSLTTLQTRRSRSSWWNRRMSLGLFVLTQQSGKTLVHLSLLGRLLPILRKSRLHRRPPVRSTIESLLSDLLDMLFLPSFLLLSSTILTNGSSPLEVHHHPFRLERPNPTTICHRSHPSWTSFLSLLPMITSAMFLSGCLLWRQTRICTVTRRLWRSFESKPETKLITRKR
jgi:hypothetical protein